MPNKFDLSLYLITDNNVLNGRDFFEVVEEAVKGGVTLVQLREKELNTIEFIKKANKLKTLLNRYGVPLIINDRYDIAVDIKSEGIHVGQSDIRVRDARRVVGENIILGATANTVEAAKKADAEGADYLGVGALFETSTKEDANLISIDLLKEIIDSVSIPVVAIGGITVDNVRLLNGIGLAGVCVCGGIMRSDNVLETCKRLKEIGV